MIDATLAHDPPTPHRSSVDHRGGHYWCTDPGQRAEMDKQAHRSLATSGTPQTIHAHARGEHCTGGCTTYRVAT